MPMMPSSKGGARPKRKGLAEPLQQKQQKRRGPENEEKATATTDSSLKQLEAQIMESRQHYNNVSFLLQKAETSPAETLYALCRVFCHLLASGDLASPVDGNESNLVISRWLRGSLDRFWGVATIRLPVLDVEEQKHCLKLLMQLLKEESLAKGAESSSNIDTFDVFGGHMHQIYDSLARVSDQLREFFVISYAAKYVDLAYAFTQYIQSAMRPAKWVESIDYAIKMLKDIGDSSPDAFWTSKADLTQDDLNKNIGKAWLIVVGQKMNKDQRKMVLKLIKTKISPILRKPEKLLDFLVDSFDQGGSTALLALSGLFHLIQEKNLDYPHFYHRVYSMLNGSILHSKHRSSFLRLLDTFLASSHLPAALVASFLKRLARLSLFAPPAAIAFIVPLTYNLLRMHPSCSFMIHRAQSGESDDPFDMNEKDPMESGALESSLWELHTLQSHYHPNVSVIARIISEQFTKPAYNMEDFLDHSYASMLEADLSKSIKKEPVIEYQIPKTIFPRSKREVTAPDDVLALWRFDS